MLSMCSRRKISNTLLKGKKQHTVLARRYFVICEKRGKQGINNPYETTLIFMSKNETNPFLNIFLLYFKYKNLCQIFE